MNISKLGVWPVEGLQARQTSEFFKISRANRLGTIHGKTHPVSISFFVSNDLVHMGEITIPSGGTGPRASERDSHAGDAVIYVEIGPITFFLPDTHAAFLVEEGEAMFIPEGVAYQCINYTGKQVRGIFAIAPGI